mmetsp:Transcript_36719/g.115626  ORF Transcript_36719/g.115626 Transcript_36719/m.115626 type:complete len:104 (-) Transcript_36719:413-724(-)|eukprot:CAMPEP_0182902086 /NCGR_PEP_ID=MMETSP0034_2-20130328/30186_1 /TAXON_ID=156128 /ORGANISM="Nephroselmis pyriformis, Strain CCMP717" /LENGTH=103 /DNA_ID=CAMNT_0025036661 /DNA_START=18 /DNA_END=329 /DNA_ORIENTATION=-
MASALTTSFARGTAPSFFGANKGLKASASGPAGEGVRSVTCMAKKKGIRVVIQVECTEQKAAGVKGISRYTTEKNRRNTPARLEIMKYNKYMKKMTLHRELKK